MKKSIKYAMGMTLLALALSSPAMAASSTGLAAWIDNMVSFGAVISKAIMNFALVGGIIFGIIFLVTCKALAKPQHEPGKFATAIVSLVLAAALIGYDSFIKDTATTIKGDNNSSSAVQQSDYGL